MKTSSGLNVFLLMVFLSSSTLAKSGTEQKNDDSYAAAVEAKLTYLPRQIQEKQQQCQLYGDPERARCEAELLRQSHEILNCPTSEKRFKEGIEYDRKLALGFFLSNPPAEIPKKIRENFEKLVASAKLKIPKVFKLNLSLAAYESPVKNADATVGGSIILSAGLWKGENPMNSNEVAAVMAHEITHVLHFHGMLLNCLAIEWTGSNFTVIQAQDAFQEDLRGSLRFDVRIETARAAAIKN